MHSIGFEALASPCLLTTLRKLQRAQDASSLRYSRNAHAWGAPPDCTCAKCTFVPKLRHTRQCKDSSCTHAETPHSHGIALRQPGRPDRARGAVAVGRDGREGRSPLGGHFVSAKHSDMAHVLQRAHLCHGAVHKTQIAPLSVGICCAVLRVLHRASKGPWQAFSEIMLQHIRLPGMPVEACDIRLRARALAMSPVLKS